MTAIPFPEPEKQNRFPLKPDTAAPPAIDPARYERLRIYQGNARKSMRDLNKAHARVCKERDALRTRVAHLESTEYFVNKLRKQNDRRVSIATLMFVMMIMVSTAVAVRLLLG